MIIVIFFLHCEKYQWNKSSDYVHILFQFYKCLLSPFYVKTPVVWEVWDAEFKQVNQTKLFPKLAKEKQSQYP